MMQIETFQCPLCGKEACYYQNRQHEYGWIHKCYEDVQICNVTMFENLDKAKADWGKYCSMIQYQLGFEYGNGYVDGMRDS